MTLLINLQGESVAYENNVALHNITLQITRGEKVALIGPSCSGLRTSEPVLENIGHSQLTLIENETVSLLELSENELELSENSLRTSVSAWIN